MHLVCLEARFDEVTINSKSRQKESDGFMLGARVEQVNEIDSVAHNDTRELFNTHEEIVSAYNLCREYVTEIRKLQKQLGIDDDTLLSATDVWNSQGVTHMKAVLASYDGAR
jgi:sulfur relay (sulfurtransferase) DsrC/TusE family protein